MAYTDPYGSELSFDLGGGPDSWEVLAVRIQAPGEQDAVVQIPIHQALAVLLEGLEQVRDGLANPGPKLTDPLAKGGRVTHVLHTPHGMSWNLIADADIVWETRLGWQIRWEPDSGLWRLTRPGHRPTRLPMQHLADRLGQAQYPIIGITVTDAPKVIHDGELGNLPHDEAYIYETAQGMTIRWDAGREMFGITGSDGVFGAFWHHLRLSEAIPPNQYPITRSN